MNKYKLVNDINVYNLSELKDLIKDYLKGYIECYDLNKNNVESILNDLINYVDDVYYDDDYLYIYLNIHGLFNINDDYKNVPLLSFYSNLLIFELNNPILKLNENTFLNIDDNILKIKNINRIE